MLLQFLQGGKFLHLLFMLRWMWLCAPVIGASNRIAAAHARSKAAKNAFHPYCWTSKESGTPAFAAPCASKILRKYFVLKQCTENTKYAIQPRNPSLAPTERRPTISAPHSPVYMNASLDEMVTLLPHASHRAYQSASVVHIKRNLS